mgnify:CR=1 FL=1
MELALTVAFHCVFEAVFAIRDCSDNRFGHAAGIIQQGSGMVDPATMVRLGKQTGARYMVYGNLASIVKDNGKVIIALATDGMPTGCSTLPQAQTAATASNAGMGA